MSTFKNDVCSHTILFGQCYYKIAPNFTHQILFETCISLALNDLTATISVRKKKKNNMIKKRESKYKDDEELKY